MKKNINFISRKKKISIEILMLLFLKHFWFLLISIFFTENFVKLNCISQVFFMDIDSIVETNVCLVFFKSNNTYHKILGTPSPLYHKWDNWGFRRSNKYWVLHDRMIIPVKQKYELIELVNLTYYGAINICHIVSPKVTI